MFFKFMINNIKITCAAGLFLTAFGACAATTIKVVAEVETKVSTPGHEAIKLVPANRVVPGDQVVYTLEIRNTGRTALASPTVSYAIPEHMRYVADSAAGPSAEVSFSVDGGHTFDRPENLRVLEPKGPLRAATAADYTNIRWKFHLSLMSNSVAFARFRAIVK
jgi:uncharacterized repeat protein (TIGR01451 family)